MNKIGNYQILKNIAQTNGSLIYQARDENSGRLVTIKAIKSQHPSPAEIARLRKEYSIIRQADIEGVIKPLEIIAHEDTFALVLEHFDGVNLHQYAQNYRPNLGAFLDIAMKLAEILGNIHKKHIVHRDIKPQNILINAQTKEIRITDFGISSLLSSDHGGLHHAVDISGTLLYMSPEQTGRMNRPVDYRTDFYSLGATLYDLLTGRTPFVCKDPLELIHSHLAKNPIPPHVLIPGLPPVISRIIQKLMAKSAEERYQNGFGLLHDLRQCRDNLTEQKNIPEFELGLKDISIMFDIPSKLFGREKESALLLQAFERTATGGCEIVMISGPPGIGKSALVQEFYSTISARPGYFISGRFEQFQRDMPYSGIIQAFKNLIRLVLSGDESQMEFFRGQLIKALGPNGKIISDIFPEIELLTGTQPAVPELDPEEAHNRFNLIFNRFFRVFNSSGQPLVLFLDDLQWADSASMELMKILMGDANLQKFLLICSYRDNETSTSASFPESIRALSKLGIPVRAISLRPLETPQINALVTNFLRCPENTCLSLATLVHIKTGGNPFFINQFLHVLYEDQLLKFNPLTGWSWDSPSIAAMQLTDNMVELMADKITTLSAGTLQTLQVCAAAGERFDLELIASALDFSLEETLEGLTEAINSGFITRLNNAYIFQHSRIQEAAYSLVPEEKRPDLHHRIGKLYLERIPQKDLPEQIFLIVGQLNRGLGSIAAPEERTVLAGLNRIAAEKARGTNAYKAAAAYAKTGISLLPENAWDTDYELSYALYLNYMHSEYLSGHADQAGQLFNVLVEHARTKADKARAYSLMLYLNITLAQYEEAIHLGLDYLRQNGIEIPRHPTKADVVRKLFALWRAMHGRTFEDLLLLPKIEDAEKLEHHQIFIALGVCSYYVDTNLYIVDALESMLSHLWEGTLENTPTILAVIAGIIGPSLGLYHAAERLGNVAGQIMQRYPGSKEQGKFLYCSALFVGHWFNHARINTPSLRSAHEICLQHGDLIFGAHSIIAEAMNRIVTGDNLDDIFTVYQEKTNLIKMVDDDFVTRSYQNQLHFYLSLKGLTENRTSLNDKNFHLDEHVRAYRQKKNTLGIFFLLLNQLRLYYLFAEYEKGCHLGEEMLKIVKLASGTIQVPEFFFYYALCMTARYRNAPFNLRPLLRMKIDACLRKMKTWTKHCPENFLHKKLLIEAEKNAWLDNTPREAMLLYEYAVNAARENGYIQNAAIAAECSAAYALKQGYHDLARIRINAAYKGYRAWGADTKVKDLEEHYADLLEIKKTTTTDAGGTDTKSATLAGVDFQSVIKSTQAISSEINLENLIARLLEIATENAGAQMCALLLDRNDKLRMVASSGRERQGGTMEDVLPMSIINYVRRSASFVILGNAGADETFGQDPVIQDRQIQSVLCMPIMEQQQFIGMLYLENNLSREAFTPERIEILNIITTQAAISIKNAMLYAECTEAGIELNAEKEYLSVTLRSIGDGVITTDMQGRITLMNAVAEELTGIRQEHALGKTFTEIFRLKQGTEIKCLAALFEHVASTGESVEVNTRPLLINTAGAEHIIELSMAPIRDKALAIGVILVFRDMSARLKMEEDLLKAQKLESLGIFARGIAHDFNNILTGIIGNASLMLKHSDPGSSQHKRLALLEKTSLRAKDLTLQLLTISKGGNPILKTIALQNLIRESAKFTLGVTDIIYECAIADDLKNVDADEGQINQVLNNLMINAKQAMPQGGTIRISAENVRLNDEDIHGLPAGEYLCIRVQDEGEGIPKDHLAKIFEPFFTTKSKGNGLGLSSTAAIIEKHGGHIGVASTVGAGTTFTIHLPASPHAITNAKICEDRALTLKSGRIMLMDDDEIIRETGTDILTQLGFSVFCFSNGEDAFSAYAAARLLGQPFDLIILDLTVPGGWGGLDTIERLQEVDPNVKALASSGYANDPVLADFKHYGFAGIIIKPYRLQELQEAIYEVLCD